MPSIGVVIITYCAKKHLPYCLPPLLQSPLQPRILVVNSSSNDGTVELAESFGVETVVLPRSSFNHGTTRELARKHLKTEIAVMMTPDAYPIDASMLEHLVDPLIKNHSSVSYARQIPHTGAKFFEAFTREFNYPRESQIRGKLEIPKYGIYTIFCSNSCAAYRNSALDEIGGFKSVLLGEDTIAVAELLQRGHRIAYVSNAVVKHSHDYTLVQEFKRHFDIGLARKQFQSMIADFGEDGNRGKEYLRQLFRKAYSTNPFLLPYAFLQIGAKWFGYQIGKRSTNAPTWFKRMLSSQDFYWK